MINAVKPSHKAAKNPDRFILITMLLSAVASLVAALVLSIDAFKLANDSSASLACDINSVISCGTVALSDQAQLLGFPNAFIGLMCEPIIILIAVSLLSGIKFKRWMMFVAQLTYFAGLIFALWLFYQSAFEIHAFCPWCLLVTIGTALTFFTLLRYNIIHENLYLSEKWNERMQMAVRVRADLLVAILLVLSIAFIILYNYGSSIFS